MKEKQSTSKWKVFSFRQTLNIRIIIAILFITIFKMNASNYAQKTKITLDLTEVKLEQVFFEIKKHTEYNVLFMNPDVDLERKVTVKVKKKTVDKILNIVFEGTDIAYEILDKQIVLTKKKETIINNQVLKVIVEEQKTTITGIVFDDAGNPLPGAGVLVKGTTQGTETDFDGNYSIEVSSNAVTLEIGRAHV